MKLHTVFITHNRLELTKRALESYLETVTVPYNIVIADNASTDGTREWIHDVFSKGLIQGMHLNKENRYPGPACNAGFELRSAAFKDATHLHRADNDFVFLPGWCNEVKRMFTKRKKLGQLGLRTAVEEHHVSTNVGGNAVFSRFLWDRGLRYDERPWPQLRDEVGAGWTEDSLISRQVRDMGWRWTRVQNPCIVPISTESEDDPYYQKTWADRGIPL
jgi:glycosyltransferase involved in cell wall biosynthesis